MPTVWISGRQLVNTRAESLERHAVNPRPMIDAFRAVRLQQQGRCLSDPCHHHIGFVI